MSDKNKEILVGFVAGLLGVLLYDEIRHAAGDLFYSKWVLIVVSALISLSVAMFAYYGFKIFLLKKKRGKIISDIDKEILPKVVAGLVMFLLYPEIRRAVGDFFYSKWVLIVVSVLISLSVVMLVYYGIKIFLLKQKK